eukprot:gene3834-4785_t
MIDDFVASPAALKQARRPSKGVAAGGGSRRNSKTGAVIGKLTPITPQRSGKSFRIRTGGLNAPEFLFASHRVAVEFPTLLESQLV